MTREIKKNIIAQIHQKHYTFVGKSFRPNKSYVKWCSDNDATLALSRLNIKDLIYRRDVPVCTKCDCIITDTDEVDLCKECWESVGWTYDEKCNDCGRYECDDWEKCLVKHRKPVIISDKICGNCEELKVKCQNTCVCGDVECEDWDKTPRDNAPKVPELPSWIVEESKRFKQKSLMAQMLELDVKMMELDALFQKC
tara:strand:- start:916 stop:1506 length:591 start_codon:yes stop_codon:yes gene_type:complete